MLSCEYLRNNCSCGAEDITIDDWEAASLGVGGVSHQPNSSQVFSQDSVVLEPCHSSCMERPHPYDAQVYVTYTIETPLMWPLVSWHDFDLFSINEFYQAPDCLCVYSNYVLKLLRKVGNASAS